MTTQPAPGIHVFYAGTHIASDGTSHTFSEADIADLVASYDPELSGAPLVVGHPRLDDPAYGETAAFVLDGTDVYAVPQDVEPQFAELVNSKRFNRISLSVYKPDTPGNPKPGHFYPKHIGFLGAAAPALKGLKPPRVSANFAADDAALEFSMPLYGVGWSVRDVFQRLRDYFVEREGAEKADQLIPQYQINSIAELTTRDDDTRPQVAFAAPTSTETDDMSEQTAAEFAERQAQLDTRQQELDARDQALRDREAAAERATRRADALAFAERLASPEVGKLLPRQVNGVVELLLALPATTVLNFSAAEGEDAADHEAGAVLRELLEAMPRQVDFSEKSGDHAAGATSAPAFAAPGGMNVDAGRMELHTRALEYQRQHPDTPYIVAVKAVGG